tara:strand:- start:289 stop:918 length:630 start_codon:yes stop_codon:yes gene_type:complete
MVLLFNPRNVIVFASSVSPIFITFYFILEGSFNGHMKWVVWMFGLFIAIISGLFLRAAGSTPESIENTAIQYDNYKDKCVTFDGPFNVSYGLLSGPSSHGIFHAFTIIYILQSILENPNSVGWSFVISLIIISSIDLMIRQKNKCSRPTDMLKGLALGAFVGILWHQIISNSTWPGKEYLYFGQENTMKKCKLSKTRFRCKQGDQTFIM